MSVSLIVYYLFSLSFPGHGQDVGLDPQALQDSFNPVFEKMKSAGVVKERNREDMFNTFQQFVNQAKSGTYNINSSAGKYLNSTYHGSDGANLGVNPDGSNPVAGSLISGQIYQFNYNSSIGKLIVNNGSTLAPYVLLGKYSPSNVSSLVIPLPSTFSKFDLDVSNSTYSSVCSTASSSSKSFPLNELFIFEKNPAMSISSYTVF